MRADCLFAITAAGALALVAACSATDQPVVQETVQDTAPDTAHVAAQGATPGIAGIMAAIEEAGFACEVQERHPDRFVQVRSEEHTSELQSLMRISYAVFCLKKKKHTTRPHKS